jgi:hypothetical protein
LVKPVNRDDLPQMRGVDGLKSGSPLGIEPKGEGIQGRTGFSVTGQNAEGNSDAPKAVEPVKSAAPAAAPKATSGTDAGSSTTSSATITRINPTLPVARVMPNDLGAPLLKP